VKDQILEFLRNKQPKLCVLSTASSDAKPESAVIGYAVMDDLTLIFSTRKNSRKAVNLLENNKASVTIGWGLTENNVQMDGTARIMDQEGENQKLESFFFEQNKDAKKFKGLGTILIIFTPTWIRYLNLSTQPPTQEEITL